VCRWGRPAVEERPEVGRFADWASFAALARVVLGWQVDRIGLRLALDDVRSLAPPEEKLCEMEVRLGGRNTSACCHPDEIFKPSPYRQPLLDYPSLKTKA
jgi:hypothetical protein